MVPTPSCKSYSPAVLFLSERHRFEVDSSYFNKFPDEGLMQTLPKEAPVLVFTAPCSISPEA